MAVYKGSIPKEVRYWYCEDNDRYSKAPTKDDFQVSWDGLYRAEKYNEDFKETGVVRQTAEVLNVGRKAPEEGKVITVPNNVLTNLQVVGMSSHRSIDDQVAVLLPNGFVVELGRDSFMEAILNEGVQKGGYLTGQWVWAKVPGGMKLIRLGTGIHRAILDYQKRDSKARLDVKTMVPGQLYKTSDNKYAIFCGFINTQTIRVRQHPADKELTAGRRYNRNDRNPAVRFDVQFNPAKLATLWYDGWRIDENTEQKELQHIVTEMLDRHSCYSFKAIKKHQYVEHVPDLKADVPDDVIMQIRNKAIEEMESQIKSEKAWFDSNRHRYNYGTGGRTEWPPYAGVSFALAKLARTYSALMCMVPYGVKSIKPSCLDRFNEYLSSKDNEISRALEEAKAAKKAAQT